VRRSAGTVALPHGALMLLYTDGLIERRGESLDTGFARLAAALRPGLPREVCREVLHDLVGSQGPGDDIALFAIRRTSG
jgi:serine phosphatase RsbU (regulator of sigma subunit)